MGVQRQLYQQPVGRVTVGGRVEVGHSCRGRTKFDRAELEVRFAPTYGRLLAWLQHRGEAIAAMDLLVATTAIVDQAALVTRNRRHFDRVPGVDIVSY